MKDITLNFPHDMNHSTPTNHQKLHSLDSGRWIILFKLKLDNL